MQDSTGMEALSNPTAAQIAAEANASAVLFNKKCLLIVYAILLMKYTPK